MILLFLNIVFISVKKYKQLVTADPHSVFCLGPDKIGFSQVGKAPKLCKAKKSSKRKTLMKILTITMIFLLIGGWHTDDEIKKTRRISHFKTFFIMNHTPLLEMNVLIN